MVIQLIRVAVAVGALVVVLLGYPILGLLLAVGVLVCRPRKEPRATGVIGCRTPTSPDDASTNRGDR